MKYFIMLLLVIGLSISDVLTGIIKSHVRNDYCSKEMKKGLWNKLGEWLVMTTACGLEFGIARLGIYYQNAELAAVTSNITSGFIFMYIVFMELLSIFENYAEMNPDAEWTKKLILKLRKFGDTDKKE